MSTTLTRHTNAVRLEFATTQAATPHNLSGAVFCGETLFVAGDELPSIERLQRLPTGGRETLRFGEPTSFPLASLVALPGAPDDEADIEGLTVQEGWLWLVGSHGYKRKNTKPDKTHAENARRLAKLSLDGNRRLLACVPLENDAQGRPTPVAQAKDGRRACRLRGDSLNNPLTRLLAGDPHFGPFMALPGKDNGFDIEGLAVDGRRVLLGLRGPVLRGWSALLEIAVEVAEDSLKLTPLDDEGTLLRKHFVQLGGLGLRDLYFAGDDLYLLAGPTMVLDGAIRVFHWPGARRTLAANHEPVRFESRHLKEAFTLPHGIGTNRAEAITQLPAELNRGGRPTWLVLYDAPGPDRRDGEHAVFGDLLREAR
jgi:hypothetical protein